MRIDPDNFEEWLSHPITEAMLRAFAVWADDAKQGWVKASWEGGQADPVFLATMRERAKVFNELRQITAEKIEDATS